jgi:hypothetical protein
VTKLLNVATFSDGAVAGEGDINTVRGGAIDLFLRKVNVMRICFFFLNERCGTISSVPFYEITCYFKKIYGITQTPEIENTIKTTQGLRKGKTRYFTSGLKRI